ncbi:MAG: hypothetical protein WCI18_11970 [Pseudomonadota bacterium]
MNQILKIFVKTNLFLMSVLFAGKLALAGEAEVGGIDSVLDRLEKKLDDQRSEVLEPYKVVKKNGKKMGQAFTSESVPANLDELKKISDLSNEISRLDSDLKTLTEKVNVQAASLTEDSKIMPRVTIFFKGLEDQKVRTKYLRFLLNDVPLFEYKLSQSSSSLPQNFKIYEGALPQGKHTLKVEGVWGWSSSRLLADEDISWSLDKKYEIQSDGQAVAKEYSLVAGAVLASKKIDISLKTGDGR